MTAKHSAPDAGQSRELLPSPRSEWPPRPAGTRVPGLGDAQPLCAARGEPPSGAGLGPAGQAGPIRF